MNDFIMELPRIVSGHDVVVVVVDRMSKMVFIAPNTSHVNSEEFAQLFLDNGVRLHSLPTELVTDRGS